MPSPGDDRACGACHPEQNATLQRTAAAPGVPSSATLPIVHSVLRASGIPLAGTTRAFLEPRLGQDLSDVRLHTDAQATQSARSVGARAYSVGVARCRRLGPLRAGHGHRRPPPRPRARPRRAAAARHRRRHAVATCGGGRGPWSNCALSIRAGASASPSAPANDTSRFRVYVTDGDGSTRWIDGQLPPGASDSAGAEGVARGGLELPGFLALGLRILPSLAHGNIHAEGLDLDALERELDAVRAALPSLFSSKTSAKRFSVGRRISPGRSPSRAHGSGVYVG